MALIKCPECGKEVSDKAKTCPNCGYPINEYVAKKNDKLICPQCGNSIVNKNSYRCPYCYAVLVEDISKYGAPVKIQLPVNVVSGGASIFTSGNVSIRDKQGVVIWRGHLGDVATIRIREPMTINIFLSGLTNIVSGQVQPNKKYRLVKDYGVHFLSTFVLTEVDVIK